MASSPDCKKPNARLWSLVSEHGVNATAVADNRFEKFNDLYLWNAWWAMFVTSTSLGYGDILSTTHFGRVVCLVSALTGLVCAATLTAALSVVLTWTDDEMSAMLMGTERAGQARSVQAFRRFDSKLDEKLFAQKEKACKSLWSHRLAT